MAALPRPTRWKLWHRIRSRVYLIAILFLIRIPVSFLPNLFFGHEPLIYQVLTVMTYLVLASMASSASEGFFDDPNLQLRLSLGVRTLLHQIVRVIVYALAALMSLQHFGISVTPILASLGVGSIAVALALQDTLGNLFSGFYILIDQPFEVGQVIRLESGIEGSVNHIGWRSTRILLGSGNLVILPNSKVSSSPITNLSLPTPETLVSIKVSVRANQDLARVERLAQITAFRIQEKFYPLDKKVFAPFIRFTEVAAGSIDVQLTVKSREDSMNGMMKHELIREIILEFQREQILLRSRP